MGAVIPERYIQRAFAGMDGWFSSADLLPRYNEWAQREGKPETTAKELGQSIGHQFVCETRKMHNNVKVWKLDEQTLAHRNWFKAT